MPKTPIPTRINASQIHELARFLQRQRCPVQQATRSHLPSTLGLPLYQEPFSIFKPTPRPSRKTQLATPTASSLMDTPQASRVPSHWLKCPKIGSLIADIFVPFKTPLDDSYRKKIDNPDLWWEPGDVMAACEDRDINLGLVIDLTFPKRFYKPAAFSSRDIAHTKIPCRGPNEPPDPAAKQKFVTICLGYTQTNPNRKIGVHCTHGFNRTGFLICAYLVEQLGWNLSTAVIAFQRAREPGIYKAEFIGALISAYGDDGDMPDAVPWPSWEDVETSPSDATEHEKRKEFMSGVPGVMFVEDSNESRRIQRKAAQWSGYDRKGFPGSQPVSMDCDNVTQLAEEHHVVTWKPDGTRYMMVIAGRNRVYFLDRDNAVFKVDGLTFFWTDLRRHLHCTLLDGEMVIYDADGENIPSYLIFDIAFCEKFPIRERPFRRRVKCIKKVVIGSRKSAIKRGMIDVTSEPFRVRMQKFHDISVAWKLLGGRCRSRIWHESDGLVFQPSAKPYKPGPCCYRLKWKPPEMSSIDFRLKIEKGDGPSLRDTVGLLFVEGMNEPFAQLAKISREECKLDGKIVECRVEQWVDGSGRRKCGWVIVRERTDKSFPNGYSTAINVMKSRQEPITKEFLIKFVNERAIKDSKWYERGLPVRTKRDRGALLDSRAPSH